VNEFGIAPTSTPTRRLGGEQYLERAAHLAGDDDLLLVPARERARRRGRIRGANVECGDLRVRILENSVRGRAARRWRTMLLAENQILGD